MRAAAEGGEQRPAARLAGAAAVLLGGFVSSRLIGLLRYAVIAAQFGTSPDYDVYVAAFLVPDTIFYLVSGGALSSALVPVLSEYVTSRRPDEVRALARNIFNAVALGAGALALAGIAGAPWLAQLYAGFEPDQQARLATLLRIMLLQPVFLAASEVLSRYLNVHHHFAFPAIAPTVYNLGIIAAALVLGPRFGTAGLAAGVSAGALAYLLIQLPAARRHGFAWAPALDLRDPGLRRVATLMIPRMVGQGAVQLSLIFTTTLASFLPAGRISAINYGFQIMMLPLGTFAMSVAGAAFPTLAQLAARGAHDDLAATLRRTLGAILFLLAPSAVALVAVGLPIVQTLAQRGSFDAESSRLTATALALYAVGLPAHGALEVLTRAFYALHDTRTPVAIGVAAMALNGALALALIAPLGFAAVPLALSASATIEALVLGALLWRRLPALASGDLARSVVRTAAAAAACAPAMYASGAAARAAGLPAALEAGAALAAGGAAYLLAATFTRSPDLADMIRLVRRRLGR